MDPVRHPREADRSLSLAVGALLAGALAGLLVILALLAAPIG